MEEVTVLGGNCCFGGGIFEAIADVDLETFLNEDLEVKGNGMSSGIADPALQVYPTGPELCFATRGKRRPMVPVIRRLALNSRNVTHFFGSIMSWFSSWSCSDQIGIVFARKGKGVCVIRYRSGWR